MRKLCLAIFVVAMMLLGGQAPHARDETLNRELVELSRYGVTHRFLDEHRIELRDTALGWTRVKTLQEPDEAAIRDWAGSRGIPVIDIDPTLVDTSQWTGWYNYWTYVPVGNDVRIRTQVRDFDGNGLPEVYGNFGGVGFPQTRAYEVYPDGSSALVNIYTPAGISTHITDVDHNGLLEIVMQRLGVNYFFEQPTPTSLPTQLKFAFNKYDGLGAYLSHEHMIDMDGDSVMDFVHRGADTTVSPHYLVYVSEYNSSIPNFDKVWFTYLPDFEDGYDVGDYDGDGKMEFLASSLGGRLWVVENTADNIYGITFEDSLALVNMYYQASGDVDRDGKREFFIGATMSNGNWTVMYESDGNNTYSPRIILHLLSGGSLDDPTYFTTDVNGDGETELVILGGGYLYVFKSNADDSYYLWYLRKGLASFSVNFHDMNGDGIKDILVTNIRNSSWVSDIYRGSPLVSVGNEPPGLPEQVALMQNYPNPFNPSTKIVYKLHIREFVSLNIYDVIGREIATLVNETKAPGEYQATWDARGYASGIYFYRLRTTTAAISKKMLLAR